MIWVEILSRQTLVESRHRHEGDTIRIVRAYDNDIILDDPHVAPHHLCISRDAEGQYIAQDLGSLNGLQDAGRGGRRDSIIMAPNMPIRIGQTWLRLRAPDHPVPPEIRLGREGGGWLLPIMLGLGLMAVTMTDRWIRDPLEPRLGTYLPLLLGLGVVTLIWGGIWALFSRLLSGTARLDRHLVVFLTASLLMVLYGHAISILSFNMDLGLFGASTPYLALAGIMLAVFLHLRVIGRSRLRLKAGVSGALALAFMVVFFVQQRETRQNFGGAITTPPLWPPAFRLAPPETESRLFERFDAMKARLDKARLDPVIGVGVTPIDDDN